MTRRSRRPGLTLFEVLLVMAVLVMVSALMYPSLKSMFGFYKLQGAVDVVRSAWAHARSRAILDGRPYRFSIEPDGSHFRIAPDQSDYWSGGSGPSEDSHGKALVFEQALPAGVRFTLNGQPSSSPTDVTSSGDEKKPSSGQWSTGTVFLPDGTAKDDVRIVFQIRGARTTAIQLRGLTGTVTVHTLP
jgi:prepilin-type N-terminal cleavage/methylation domain-containing protein